MVQVLTPYASATAPATPANSAGQSTAHRPPAVALEVMPPASRLPAAATATRHTNESRARGRAFIMARFAALVLASRASDASASQPAGELFHPAARCSLIGAADAEPILTPHERRALRLAVEIARDAELWTIGRHSPCGWLLVVAAPTA